MAKKKTKIKDEEIEVITTLILNPEKTYATFDSKNDKFIIFNKTKVRKSSKYSKIYKINTSEKKYLKMLKENPEKLKLEYSLMEYFILISSVPLKELNLLKGMKVNGKIEIFDGDSTLNISEIRDSSNC